MKPVWLIAPLLLVSCAGTGNSSGTGGTFSSIESTSEATSMDKELTLSIDGQELDVSFEDNASVEALKELSADGLELNASRYGGFEQVASLGTSIVSEDTRLTSEPGDIFLYASSSIVVFFGSNTWSYTRIGHINGLDEEGLTALLDKPSAVFNFSLN